MIWKAGQLLAFGKSLDIDSEILMTPLSFGTHIIEVYEFANISGTGSGDVCFDVEVD